MRKTLTVLLLSTVCSFCIAQQAMNNDAVIKLAKAGLSDDLIVSTVNASPGVYDTSASGIIALKGAGLSDKVVSAILLKAAGAPAAATAPTAPSSSALPAGIDDVGVYYKDKSGTWKPLMPEIVNFKTGGVLKNIASAGLVKGDINGHLANAHAKTSLTSPVVLAVYVPEGTAITEYQLLRLRPSGDSREFRSVTGGVMHTSGGATRDLIEFEPQKIMPRVYQITIDANSGKGEYGLLPPGSYGSSNMGSSGKMYTLTIIE